MGMEQGLFATHHILAHVCIVLEEAFDACFWGVPSTDVLVDTRCMAVSRMSRILSSGSKIAGGEPCSVISGELLL